MTATLTNKEYFFLIRFLTFEKPVSRNIQKVHSPNECSLGKKYFLNAFYEELFHTVASTKSNELKILMIMKSCKQAKVTYAEFAKQTIFLKKGLFYHNLRRK